MSRRELRTPKALQADAAALAKAYNVSKSQVRDEIVGIFLSFVRNRRAFIGMLILLIYIFMAIFGPILADPRMMKSNIRNKLSGPTREHPLGTDNTGRDTLTQFVYGARQVLTVAFIAAVMTLLIASFIGMLAGFVGGLLDAILMFITNIILTVPSMPIMMLLSTVIKVDNPLLFGVVLSVWAWAGLARSIRAQILSIKTRDFIEASKILGMSKRHIILNEMLPGITSFLTMNLIFSMRAAISASVALMFLGLAKFQSSHWGMMLQIAISATGALFGSSALIYFLTPVVGIAIFGIGSFFFASGLDEALNPRLRTK
jgi:peptide/nickel transport system permease protein